MKTCKVCKQEQPLDMYTSVGGYYRGKCRPCYNTWQRAYTKRIRSPKYYKTVDLKRRYGLGLNDYEHMLADQDNACAICKREVTLVVDHNHMTKQVRGLLCGRCNRALGMIEENPELADELAVYLRTRA